MPVNEYYVDGVLAVAKSFDLATGLYTRVEHGQVVESRPMTAEEIAAVPVDRGLDADGKLATAFAVLGLLPTESAAALVGLPAQALVDEALAWGAAGSL